MKYLFLILFLPTVVTAKDLAIAWQDVLGNNGYMIELRKAGETDASGYNTPINSYTFHDIKPGKYYIRVAALNKFKKPARFTDWKEILVSTDRKKQTFQMDKKEPQTKKESGFQWHNSMLVPGLIQWQSGDKKKAVVIWSIATLLAYEGNRYRIEGNRLASEPMNQPVNMILFSMNQPSLITYYLLHNRNSSRQEYDRLQDKQRQIGILFLATLAFHFIDIRNYNNSAIAFRMDIYPDQKENYGLFSFTIRY